MSDADEPTELGAEEEKRMKRRKSLEAQVNLGLGMGKRKQSIIEAFNSSVWPVLEGGGWSIAKGEGEAEGTTYFLPPGISMDDKDNVISSPTQNENNTSSAQQVNNKEEDEDDGPWDCPSCGYTNTTSKARCTNILRDNTGDGRQDKCMAWREGKRKKYYKKIKDVLQRVLEKKNEAESMAADAFLELIPDGADIFLPNQKRDKGSGGDSSLSPTPDKRYTDAYNPHSPDRLTPRQHHAIHFGWKDEGRTHYEKAESKVGPEYQVDVLPAAGSYATTDNTADVNDGGALYERVWDPETAEKAGREDFVHTRVNPNRKEKAYDIFYSRDYRLPGFYHEVSSLPPSDASDWTKEDKERFRSAVFEHHEDMRTVSKAIGKPINQCITHYIVKFKRTKSYKSLKRSMIRKANVEEGNAGQLVCNECGKGGMLIACDTCEAHYHLGCAFPPLKEIPDGTWQCGNCRRDTRSMLASSSQDEMSQQQSVDMDASMSGGDDADADNGKLSSNSNYIRMHGKLVQPCPEIGPGWSMEIRTRASSNQKDKFWFSPEGTMFRSKIAVERYLYSIDEEKPVASEENNGDLKPAANSEAEDMSVEETSGDAKKGKSGDDEEEEEEQSIENGSSPVHKKMRITASDDMGAV